MDLKATNRTINNFMRKIKELMQKGFTVDEAVAKAYNFYPVMELMRREVKAKLKAAAERGFGDTLPDDTADVLERTPWTTDGLSLSERTTRGSIAVQSAVIATINEAVRKGKSVKTAATKLFDGYGYGGIIPKQDIPGFMTELYRLSAGPDYKDADFKKLLRRIERNVSQLRTAPLKVAYNDLLIAIENRNDKALDRAIYIATQERTRYYAERIARTELARAYHDGFMAKWADDSDVKAFKWQLSSAHPVHDICDLYANADLYGLGKGIFPKDKVPMLPAHPHCMCHLKPIFDIDLSKQKDRVEQGGKEFIATLSKREKEHLLGVYGTRRVGQGVSWTQKARGYSNKKLVGRLSVDSKGEKVYTKTVEYNGRQAKIYTRKDGSIVVTEKHDINKSYSPSNKSKPNAVILHGSPAGGGNRQYGIRIYDLNGDTLVSFHYGHHGNPKRHPYGKCVNGVKTGYHKHYWMPKENGIYEPEKGEELSDIEEVFLKGLI